MEGAAEWGRFYRENIDIFVHEYLQLDFLKWFQDILLVMMNKARTSVIIAARGLGKSFLIAIFAVSKCILYPGTKVVITSGTRSQSINVLEKIQTELIPRSPTLRAEIDMRQTRFSGQDARIMFKNSSYIKVVTASDNARSNRANLLIVDELTSKLTFPETGSKNKLSNCWKSLKQDRPQRSIEIQTCATA